MDKIYSRTRLQLPKMQWTGKLPEDKGKRKKIKILVIVIIAVITASYVLKSIVPVYDRVCEAEAKAVATRISNEQATVVMKNYDYDDIFTIYKDTEGNVTAIKSNMITINEIISDVAAKIQKELDQIRKSRNKNGIR